MWFSVGYKAEVDALKRINDLIDAEVIRSEEFKKVELIEIEPETSAGYFRYFVEGDRAVIYAAEESRVLLGDRENPARLSIQEAGKIAIIDGEAMKKDGGHG
jgi:hypothetical protein